MMKFFWRGICTVLVTSSLNTIANSHVGLYRIVPVKAAHLLLHLIHQGSKLYEK
jgi:hypothetical protein